MNYRLTNNIVGANKGENICVIARRKAFIVNIPHLLLFIENVKQRQVYLSEQRHFEGKTYDYSFTATRFPVVHYFSSVMQ